MTDSESHGSEGKQVAVFKSDLERGTITRCFPNVECQCPFNDETDKYDVEIEFEPSSGWVFEIGSMAEYLDGFADEEITEEALAQTVFDTLWEEVGPHSLTVTVWGYHESVEGQTEVSRGR